MGEKSTCRTQYKIKVDETQYKIKIYEALEAWHNW